MLLRCQRGWRMDGMTLSTWRHCRSSKLPSQMSFSRADFGCPLDLNMGRFYKRCCIQMKFFPTHRNLFWSVLFSFLSILCASFQSLDKTFPTVPARCHRGLGPVAARSPPPATDWINNKLPPCCRSQWRFSSISLFSIWFAPTRNAPDKAHGLKHAICCWFNLFDLQ